jgi:hypothetical protein
MAPTTRRRFVGIVLGSAVFLIVQVPVSGQETAPAPLKVLFIGNSYTSVNDLPGLVVGLADAAGGRKIEVDRHLVGGCTLEKHVKDRKAIDKIRAAKWDVVVLQEHSLQPISDRDSMYRNARILDEEIKKRGAKTVFYLTWARQHIPEMLYGSASAKPPESVEYLKAMYQISGVAKSMDLEAWRKRASDGLAWGLNGAYLDIAKNLGAGVAPVGIAWKMALAADPPFVLHSPDKSHPNPTGTYLAACVFYATLLDASPVGLPGTIKQGDKVLANIPGDQAKRLQEIAWAAVKAITFTTATIHTANPQPVSLIFDTDITGDVDDVGAVAVLHALANRGEAKILAMGFCVKNPWGALCLDSLNTYFQRPDIPLGVVKGPAHPSPTNYAQGIAQEFPHTLQSGEDAPDAALVYRRVLAKQPDRSVVMMSVGALTNFRNLLKTGPDQYTNLDGVELVKQKVRAWVCMGGRFPEGRETNLVIDGPAAAFAIAHWPTPIIFSGWEIGNEIMTGAGLRQAPAGTPVRRAYELYNGLNNRQSWDQTAVLYAVRGLDNGLADYWDVKSSGYLQVHEDGSNVWRDSPDKDHAYLVRKMDPKKIAEVIEELMLRRP